MAVKAEYLSYSAPRVTVQTAWTVTLIHMPLLIFSIGNVNFFVVYYKYITEML